MSTSRNPQQDRNGGADSQNSMPFGSFEGITKTMQVQFAAAIAVPQAVLEANLTMGSELFGFIGRRMKAQAEWCSELSQCREVAEAVAAHRKFGERVTSDYSSEIGQLATIMSKELAIVGTVATEVVGEAGKAGKLAA